MTAPAASQHDDGIAWAAMAPSVTRGLAMPSDPDGFRQARPSSIGYLPDGKDSRRLPPAILRLSSSVLKLLQEAAGHPAPDRIA